MLLKGIPMGYQTTMFVNSSVLGWNMLENISSCSTPSRYKKKPGGHLRTEAVYIPRNARPFVVMSHKHSGTMESEMDTMGPKLQKLVLKN